MIVSKRPLFPPESIRLATSLATVVRQRRSNVGPGDFHAGFITDFEEQGAGAASGVIDGGAGGGGCVADADDLGHDAADLGGGVELALALAALGGEVVHEVFVGVAEDVPPSARFLLKSSALFSKMAIRRLQPGLAAALRRL